MWPHSDPNACRLGRAFNPFRRCAAVGPEPSAGAVAALLRPPDGRPALQGGLAPRPARQEGHGNCSARLFNLVCRAERFVSLFAGRRVCRCWATFQSSRRHILEHLTCPQRDLYSNDLLSCHRQEGKDREAGCHQLCSFGHHQEVAVGSFLAPGWGHLRLGHRSPPPAFLTTASDCVSLPGKLCGTDGSSEAFAEFRKLRILKGGHCQTDVSSAASSMPSGCCLLVSPLLSSWLCAPGSPTQLSADAGSASSWRRGSLNGLFFLLLFQKDKSCLWIWKPLTWTETQR